MMMNKVAGFAYKGAIFSPEKKFPQKFKKNYFLLSPLVIVFFIAAIMLSGDNSSSKQILFLSITPAVNPNIFS